MNSSFLILSKQILKESVNMKIVYLLLVVVFLQGEVQSVPSRDEISDLRSPVLEFSYCTTARTKTQHTIFEFNKLEIVNRLREYSLAALFAERGIMPEDNTDFNNYLTCIWRDEGYLAKQDELNYDKLARVLRDAIVKVVGNTGPSINLSMMAATEIMEQCKGITGFNVGNRIAKVQNHIVNSLQPFTTI